MTRRTQFVVGLLLAWTLALALVGWGKYGDHVREADRASSDKAAVAVAREQVLGLTTLDYRKVDAQVAALVARTTGGFRQQFQLMAKTFEQVVTSSKITADGAVVAAGLSQRSGDDAKVLIASKATVKNTGSAQPTDRTYRMRVSLHRRDNGDWLVSNMEFVP